MAYRSVRALLPLLVATTAMLAMPGAASSQQAGSVTISGLRVSEGRAELAATVLDGSRRPVGALLSADFSVTVDGARTGAVSVQQALDRDLGMALAIVVDTSGSMQGTPMATAKAVIRPLIAALGPADRAVLVAFADRVTAAAGPTADRSALTAALDALVATGNTALYSAVSETLAAIAPLPEPRRVVVVLSDGQDFGAVSSVSREAALVAAAGAGIPFFIAALGTDVDLPFLDQLAQATGGVRFSAATATELATIYDEISARLRLQYALSVPLPAGLSPGTHRLSVTVAGATAEAPFTVAGPPPTVPPVPAVPAAPALTGIAGTLNEPAVARLSGITPGTLVRFLVDESSLTAEADGLSAAIDPYDLAPGKHVLRALPETGEPIEHRFTVTRLPPLILGPAASAALGTGDTLRPVIRAQPGPLTAVFLVDGREAARQEDQPHEFILPGGLASGPHTVTVVLESPSGTARAEYSFAVTASSNEGSSLSILAGGIAMLLVVATVAFLAVRRSRRRILPTVRRPGSAQPGSPGRSVWGRLVVVEGPAAGRSFDLQQEVELVGRGRACTVRIDDPALAREHFVLSRDGTVCPSTPETAISVGGRETRRAVLAAGSEIRAGSSSFRFGPANGANGE